VGSGFDRTPPRRRLAPQQRKAPGLVNRARSTKPRPPLTTPNRTRQPNNPHRQTHKTCGSPHKMSTEYSLSLSGAASLCAWARKPATNPTPTNNHNFRVRMESARPRETVPHDASGCRAEVVVTYGVSVITPGQRIGLIVLDAEEVRASNPLAPTRLRTPLWVRVPALPWVLNLVGCWWRRFKSSSAHEIADSTVGGEYRAPSDRGLPGTRPRVLVLARRQGGGGGGGESSGAGGGGGADSSR
jgi:hypothetical protein